MSEINKKTHVPHRTRIFPSSIEATKASSSLLFNAQPEISQKIIRFQSPRKVAKLSQLVFDNKRNLHDRNYSLPQLQMSFKGSAPKIVFQDEGSNSKRGRSKDFQKDYVPSLASPVQSEIELKDTSMILQSIVFGDTNKLGSRKNVSPARSPDNSKENLLKLISYTKSLKAISNEIGLQPTRKKAKLCQNLLTCLSREDGRYKEETNLLRIEIRNSIFCSSEELMERIDSISTDILKNLSRISMPYFEMVDNLITYIERYKKEMNEKEEENRNLVFKLNNQIEIQGGYKNGNLLEEQKSDIEKIIRDFNTSLTRLQLEKDRLYLDLKHPIEDVEAVVGSTQVDEYTEQIKMLTKQRLQIERQLREKSFEAEKIKDNYMSIIEFYKASFIKANTLNSQINKLEEQISNLKTENEQLAIKLTVTSNTKDLTTRPNLEPILKFLGLESKKLESTAEKINLINSVIKHNEPR